MLESVIAIVLIAQQQQLEDLVEAEFQATVAREKTERAIAF